MDETVTGDSNPAEATVTSSSSATKTAAQSSVITVYKAKIGISHRIVTVAWTKTLINHSLSVSIDHFPACKIDLKPWPFWGKKGFKSLDIGDQCVDLFWDLRSAKFSGPEPAGGYYVALVSGEEIVLLVGDFKKEAFRRTKARPSLDDAAMVSKRDNVFGKKCFSTRVRFDGGKKEHDVVVENSISGDGDAEMWISIDGEVAIHVRNLQWKFRGNETVVVESSPVEVLWDAHGWLFGGAGVGHALFIFKPGTKAEELPPAGFPATGLPAAEGNGGDDKGWLIENGGSPEFCFMLYAWKVE